MNLVEPLLHYATQQPDQIALSDGNKCRTYSALVQRMKQIALGLQRNGLNHDRIAIISTNRIEFVEVFLGAIYAGCVPIPLDPKWSSKEVNAIVEQCQPKMIFAETAFAKKLVLHDKQIQLLTFSAAEEAGFYESWIDTLQPEAEIDNTNELLFIGFTSGTTGTPKGYMRTHLSWLNSFKSTSEAFQLNNMTHVLAPGPFVHSLSLFAIMQSLYTGATFHIVKDFNASKVLQLCKQIPEMILYVVPTMIESMIQETIPRATQIQALISSGGKWTETSKNRCKEVFGGVKLYEFYGSSEASYISYLDIHAANKLNSVGRPFHGVEISIRDEHFQEVPTDSIGQLYIRSEMMFKGYYQLLEETTSVFRDGWLITGDFMYIDQYGYLYMAGRSNNMMVTGGLNVFPEEVESVLQQIPEIQEVMVLGVPDAYWGEQVTALVKWSGQQRLSTEEIKNYCRQHLASYKSPKQIITVDQFIYTSSGKMARQAMKDDMKRVMV
ncbi:AMP-binding protein [Paenibacillus macquariensis]|uniref:Long-chain acyl-CoA synthetase n=1 Tax=Paenibacillus macquariensis TaxID=948756 RepID=A0ABY1JPZ2_9BACL|nr:AMP-binding protein [Paenibacillus macquariensis]MEC0094077.1 AMP-binding protein [Paenibacillus macquariensis]OAB37537.1 acyl-CoA synthetase [Paenibacillus macquariensis subsp. macquariensis]SIQ55837.1 long-chain acyl-CoA synthetase [Paenibacillus macquariensis]